MKKNILVIIRTAPYGQSKAKDAIDFILTAAAYDQDLHVLFQGDGAFQLIANQDSAELGLKNINKQLSAFEMYEIDNLYIDRESLFERALDESILSPSEISIVNKQAIEQLFKRADTVLSF